ncbi:MULTISPECIES: hypothetical protein [unclassified Nocardia]|uniref:hypothetical protein n=1 Tax=unclassified Nocardia TaxID=2637762 RepID=UPI001CE3C7BA|nr:MULTISPECIES: hypothetical protein [unclassified Nocardia]
MKSIRKIGLPALAACALLTACGSGSHPTTESSTASTRPQPDSAVQGAPQATVPVGAVPGNPAAAQAIQPWARDLVGGDFDRLIRNCWTIEPSRAREMYGDKDGILAALAQPGRDGQFTVTWEGPTKTVHVYRDEIASGYACPRVSATGAFTTLNEIDARYALHRYLGRWTASPVNPDDTEDKYPLVCPGSPLADNPGKVTGADAFDEGKSTVAAADYGGYDITVPVSSRYRQSLTFRLAIGPWGYCVSDAN